MAADYRRSSRPASFSTRAAAAPRARAPQRPSRSRGERLGLARRSAAAAARRRSLSASELAARRARRARVGAAAASARSALFSARQLLEPLGRPADRLLEQLEAVFHASSLTLPGSRAPPRAARARRRRRRLHLLARERALRVLEAQAHASGSPSRRAPGCRRSGRRGAPSAAARPPRRARASSTAAAELASSHTIERSRSTAGKRSSGAKRATRGAVLQQRVDRELDHHRLVPQLEPRAQRRGAARRRSRARAALARRRSAAARVQERGRRRSRVELRRAAPRAARTAARAMPLHVEEVERPRPRRPVARLRRRPRAGARAAAPRAARSGSGQEHAAELEDRHVAAARAAGSCAACRDEARQHQRRAQRVLLHRERVREARTPGAGTDRRAPATKA